MSKCCRDCGEEKPLESFPHSGTAHRSRCRDCFNAHRRARHARRHPEDHDYAKSVIPDGFRIKGITQYIKDGKVAGQHVKTELEPAQKEDRAQAMLEALRGMCEPYRGTAEPVTEPDDYDADLMTVLPIGDLHVGLKCHVDEVGEDWDMAKAESHFMGAVDGLFEVAPKAAEALIVNVGDYLHADNSRGQTTKGTPLDVDGSRFQAILMALKLFRRCIDRALLTHKRVSVICATGNHDGESSVWLRLCLALVYEREPRVVIDQAPVKFHYKRWGKCFFGVTHGDTCKTSDLPLLMATDKPEDWAATEHRAWITGHIHHLTTKEMPGCVVRSYRSQAKRDKWHDWSGYRSERDLRLEVWHKEHGQVQEFIHSLRRTQARLAAHV